MFSKISKILLGGSAPESPFFTVFRCAFCAIPGCSRAGVLKENGRRGPPPELPPGTPPWDQKWAPKLDPDPTKIGGARFLLYFA